MQLSACLHRTVYKNRQRDLQGDRTDPLHRCEVELVSRRGPENRELMVGYLLLCGLQCRHSLLHQTTVDHGCSKEIAHRRHTKNQKSFNAAMSGAVHQRIFPGKMFFQAEFHGDPPATLLKKCCCKPTVNRIQPDIVPDHASGHRQHDGMADLL